MTIFCEAATERQADGESRGASSNDGEDPSPSANRMFVKLIENEIEAEKQKQEEFFELAERFGSAINLGGMFRRASVRKGAKSRMRSQPRMQTLRL